MGAGLIYAGIVAAWVAILVPRWLARHDERAPVVREFEPEELAQAVRDRATSTGRVLDRQARRKARAGLASVSGSAPGGGRSVVPRGAGAGPAASRRTRRSAQAATGARPSPPAGSGSRSPHSPATAGTRPLHPPAGPGSRQPAGRRDPGARVRGGAGRSRAPVAARPTAQARRRRSVLVLLAIVAVALGATAGLALVPPWVAGAGLAVLIGYLGRLRLEAKRARRRDRRRQLMARQAAARRRAVQAARRRGGIGGLSRRRAEPPGRPVLVNADGTWNPIPLPLPTYITAPIVDRPAARVIDVSASGAAWTSGRLRTEPVAQPNSDGEPADEPKVVNG